MGGFSKLFGGGAPKPQPVVRMPDRNDPKIAEERRRKMMETAQTKGRESTDLTGGGGSYFNDLLGS